MAQDNNITGPMVRLMLALAGIVVVVFIIANVGYYILKSDLPAFLDTMVETAKQKEDVMTRIGGYQGDEYTFNKNNLAKDTLPYEVIVKGETAYLKITGYATKRAEEWVPVTRDSTFHSYE
ncbi:hypothetical protein ACW9KT_21920 [Hymenobacter sp. HD11105]